MKGAKKCSEGWAQDDENGNFEGLSSYAHHTANHTDSKVFCFVQNATPIILHAL